MAQPPSEVARERPTAGASAGDLAQNEETKLSPNEVGSGARLDDD
jgi:hypothetical protein